MKKYWYILGIGIGMLVITVLFWPQTQKSNQISQKKVTPIREDQYLPVEIMKPKEVTWTNTNTSEPEGITQFSIVRQLIDQERENKIKGILGMNDKNGYIDTTNNIISYTEEITNLSQLPSSGNWDVAALKEDLKSLVMNVNEDNNLEIKWDSVKYEKIMYPRWVESTEGEAQSIVISGDYLIGGVRSTTYFGDCIQGTFNREGKLIKLYLNLEPTIVKDNGKIELASTSIVSQSPASIYGIVNDGGMDSIDKVTVSSATIVEVFDNERNIMNPYYWLEGSTWMENKPTRITMLLRANK